MKKELFKLLANTAAGVSLFVAMGSISMQAGTIILEGSDAIGYHCPGGNASACTYEAQAWEALDGASQLPIAVIASDGQTFSNQGATSGGNPITIDNFTSIDAAAAANGGSLTGYAAVYLLAGGGCCAEDDSLVASPAEQNLLSSYVGTPGAMAGGTVMIENYTGGSGYDFLVGTGGNGNANVAGVSGGSPVTSDDCDDGETVTAAGLTNGFTQPGLLSCWEHQAYNEAFFAPLGFTQSYFDAAPGMVSGATTGWSGLLSDGDTITGVASSTPEPVSFVLIASGLVGMGLLRRRRKA